MKRFDYAFPDGKKKAVTFSYDDGREQDRRLVAIFNRYGIRATFHLNSGKLGEDRYVREDEVESLYRGHEVSAHTVTHPFLTEVPAERIATELLEDRAKLESLVGYPVRGMSYPFGAFSPSVVSLLPALGIVYARTTISTQRLAAFPDDFLRWEATCHHKDRLAERIEQLIAAPEGRNMSLLYVWGHSYEFDNDGNWDMIERAAERLREHADTVWSATNIEYYDYVQALRRLQCTVNGDVVHNPSALPVWIRYGGKAVRIGGGETVRL
ncbi:polysaccharide deacetylase family protein [Paenibacillus flagellatus]|uniref:Polysaccharide deacetylase n=1 Tax=Paenibacillus flagellatus TaxID=2211139 RepID=A0A2V5K3F2_9BACL|nr:polysaccharide deacetylase family protein [Paenibacillus flagellatus]PYI52143.1 polysaccharide deacetylase [Paenibacillus flagellatus]